MEANDVKEVEPTEMKSNGNKYIKFICVLYQCKKYDVQYDTFSNLKSLNNNRMFIFKLDNLNNQVEDQVNDADTDSKQPKDIQNERVLENEDVEQTNIGGKNFVNIINRMKQCYGRYL